MSLQDTAGSTSKYTNTFVVTTSFADLATVIDQYADNALRTTLNGATAVGATGLRLREPGRVPRRPADRRRLGRQPGDGDDRQGARARRRPVDTTLSAAATAGATEVRLASYTQRRLDRHATRRRNNGPIIGQPIVLDTGANQEVVTVLRHISPLPAAPAPNVVLSAPLAKDHAAGTATTLDQRDPQPRR